MNYGKLRCEIFRRNNNKLGLRGGETIIFKVFFVLGGNSNKNFSPLSKSIFFFVVVQLVTMYVSSLTKIGYPFTIESQKIVSKLLSSTVVTIESKHT